MKDVINNRLIASTKPGPKPYEVRDTRLKGFILRVQPSGIMSYVCEYARGKRMTIARVGVLVPAKAREEAAKILGRAALGDDPMKTRKEARAENFQTFLERHYGPWAETNRKTGKATVARLRSCFPGFDKKKFHEITAWSVEKWRSSRLKSGIQPSTVNRDVTALRAALSKAVEWGLISENPLKGLKNAKVDKSPRIRFLDGREEAALREALASESANRSDHLKPLVILALNTGLRRGELFALTWDDVDFDIANITVVGRHSKSGDSRHIPLNEEAIATLKEWRLQSGSREGLVFPGRGGRPFSTVKYAWANALNRAGIKNFRWHDLRHTFASNLVMKGVDLNTVRELMGHADIKTTLIYAHLAPQHKAEAVAKLVQ